MPLPVAQLGYMPNLSGPSHVPNYIKPNPWQDLALGLLGAALGQGVKNVMSRDFNATAAQQDPSAGVTIGAPISPMTGQTVGAAPPKPQTANAPWWERAVMGPRMGEQQYSQVRNERAAASQQERGQTFTAGENEKDRYARSAESSMTQSHQEQLARAAEEAAAGRQTEALAVQRQGQAQTGDIARMNADLQRQELAARQAGTVPQQMSAQADMLNATTRAAATGPDARVAEDLMAAWVKYQAEYMRSAQTAQVLGQPTPPPMSIDQFIQQYMQLRSGVGQQLQAQPMR